MNADQAKEILMLCRQHTADEQDPQVRAALALAERDPELARWLSQHRSRQAALRDKFRQIAVPEGLKEQIISEHAASRRRAPRRFQLLAAAAAALVAVLILGVQAGIIHRSRPADDTLAVFQEQMARYALRGYAMDLLTNDASQIRSYLEHQQSPADYTLTPPLQQTALSGCSVEGWQAGRVSMICFRTGKPLPPGSQSDLWLFVADQKSVKGAPADSLPHISRLNRLVTATWVQGGKLYFLATRGSEPDIRSYL
jgi:hypothetical protein